MSIDESIPSLESFFQSDLWVFCSSIVITYEIVFWLCNGFLIYIELVDIPSIDQYRIQKHKKKLRFQSDIVHLMIKETIYHQITFITLTPVLYYLFMYFGHINIQGVQPSWSTVLIQLVLFILAEDTSFFWIHYLLHIPWLYKHIHKQHHIYRQPTGVTAVLSHPLEGVLTQIPVWFMPMFLSETHLLTICLWIAIRVYQTVLAHSGYDFPYITTQYWFPELMPGALAHDYHHQYGTMSYGSFFSIWDQLMGTHKLSKRKI